MLHTSGADVQIVSMASIFESSSSIPKPGDVPTATRPSTGVGMSFSKCSFWCTRLTRYSIFGQTLGGLLATTCMPVGFGSAAVITYWVGYETLTTV